MRSTPLLPLLCLSFFTFEVLGAVYQKTKNLVGVDGFLEEFEVLSIPDPTNGRVYVLQKPDWK
jgi:hypothetical protein